MWLRRKKVALPMESLLKLIEFAVNAAAGSCTECIIDELGNENAELPAAIVDLQDAYASRASSPHGEQDFADALAKFLSLATEMAIFTAELMHRPGVRWTDESTEIALPIVIIPN
jgi:hypothetical protein